ncbi:LLM class flavin-dependent oxidoreductase [Nocardioides sp. KR10-350]|uniref:LLM class flavin-dependent oxidoreductase n=1 Tax=Nocardioides cheoyonin TaxID=3156615 RepID=UPI0032B5C574
MTSPDRQLHLGVNIYADGIHAAAWRTLEDPLAHLTLKHYAEVAREAERGTFDVVFMADVPAWGEDQTGRANPSLEPTVVLGGLAAVTERVGLVGTLSTTFNDPYNLARRFSTLDHVSGGRAAWNAVTTYAPAAAANFGLPELPEHDDRYARADEFIEVATKLWDAWEDDAYVAELGEKLVESGRIHPIDHRGEHFTVRGPLPLGRSPQGRPVLVQAGGSEQGKDLAARWAELVFAAQTTLPEAQRFYAEMKRRTAAYGRDPQTINIMPGLCTVIGSTEEEARARKTELDEIAGTEWAVARMLTQLGVGPDEIDLDERLPESLLVSLEKGGGSRGFVEAITSLAREGHTAREIALLGAGMHRWAIGTPEQIADTIEHWFREGAADGFNLMPDVLPAGLTTFVDEVVPLLRQRGLFRHEYAGQTLRDHLGLPRPASRYATRDVVGAL